MIKWCCIYSLSCHLRRPFAAIYPSLSISRLIFVRLIFCARFIDVWITRQTRNKWNTYLNAAPLPHRDDFERANEKKNCYIVLNWWRWRQEGKSGISSYANRNLNRFKLNKSTKKKWFQQQGLNIEKWKALYRAHGIFLDLCIQAFGAQPLAPECTCKHMEFFNFSLQYSIHFSFFWKTCFQFKQK